MEDIKKQEIKKYFVNEFEHLKLLLRQQNYDAILSNKQTYEQLFIEDTPTKKRKRNF